MRATRWTEGSFYFLVKSKLMWTDLPIIKQTIVFLYTAHIFPFPLVLAMILQDPSALVKKAVAVTYGLFLVLAYAITSSWILSPFLAYGMMELILRIMLSMTV
jgi:hypothetical protein